MDYISIIHSLRRVTAIMLVLMVFTLLQSCKKCRDNDVIPIMALHHTYNRIKPTVIADGMLYVEDDRLKDI